MTSLPLLLAALAACSEDEASVCHGDHVLHISPSNALVEVTADDAFIITYDILGGSSTQVGPACGAEPTRTITGMALFPARIHVDPADDDPTIVCDIDQRQLYRLDPANDVAMRLLLPHLKCPGHLTPHGPLFETRIDSNPLWLVPDFPDDSTAVAIGAEVREFKVVDDLVYHLDSDHELARTVLATHTTTALSGDVADFQATTTHVLIRSDVDPDTAPLSVLDIATGELAYIALYHADEDGHSNRSTIGLSWGFDPTGHYVMHMAQEPSPLAAFDLTGAPVAFPALGEVVHVHPNGVHVVCSATKIVAAWPGDPDVIPLDTPTCKYASFVDDHLEAIIDDDLYHVPLDGSPRSLLARKIGPAREWLDEHNLLTVYGGDLVTVVASLNFRQGHAGNVWNFRVFPGLGVYYTKFPNHPAEASDGLWFLPESRVYPRPPDCLTGYYCR